MRDSLLGSLLFTLRSSLRSRDRAALFELARVWRGPLEPLPDERRHIGIVMAGSRHPAHWSGKAEAMDFYDAKGAVEALFHAFRLRPRPQRVADQRDCVIDVIERLIEPMQMP